MRKRSVKIILGTLAVSAVLGVGVAVAATQPSWTGGHGPQVTNMANGMRAGDQVRARDGTGSRHDQMQGRMQQRMRDGTGPRHEQMESRMQQRMRDGTGPRHDQQSAQNATRGPNCPYRS